MINVSILALENVVLASLDDARYVFGFVNNLLKQSGREPVFYVQLVGQKQIVEVNNGLFKIYPDVQMNEVKETDLIIIPSMQGDMMSATHLNKEFGHWIAVQYKNGAQVASLCVGAFLMAFAGILKGKQCTTHWQYANEFRYFYPSVNLVDEKVLTHQNGVYSSGGSNAYWNLLLYLVEKFTDRQTAIQTAKYFVIDIDRNNQSPFIIFHGQKNHDDSLIREVQEFIEVNFEEKLTVDELASRFHLTRRTIERRFKKATRNTVAEYIQLVKVEAAKKQLEIGRKSIREIMFEIGYSDIQTFRDIFKRITGMTPVEYLKKYKK